MPVATSYPGLYVEELPSASHAIVAAPTSITAFVGYTHPFVGECAEQGLWGEAIHIFSFADYERMFGGLYRSNLIDWNVAYAVYQFFLNGGSDAYVVGLQPQYRVPEDARHPATPVAAPSDGTVPGVCFTSRVITDLDPLKVTVGNVRSSRDGTNDLADLLVSQGSRLESYRGVKLVGGNASDVVDSDFIETRLSGSKLVRVSPSANGQYPASYELGSGNASLTLTLSEMPLPDNTWPQTGVTTFAASQFIEVFQDNSSLDKVDIFNILAVPGVADAAIWSAALAFCERKRAFYVVDPPQNAGADETTRLTTIESIAKSSLFPTGGPNASFYFPYVKSIDPLRAETISLPPSGFVTGVFARTDTKRGVWKAPAGLETSIVNTTGVVDEGRMTDQRQGTLNPLGVNVLRSFPGSGTVVWGARTTVAGNTAFAQWHYVPVRRTALFIEQSLVRNLGWVVFEPNDEPLWAAIRVTVSAFMLSLFRQGAFQGRTPSEAFLVKCDGDTTSQTDIDLGRVNILVGFCPLKPAEFVVIQIAQLAGQAQA